MAQVMETTIFSSREFNQHATEAKKAADKGPVFITDRGRTRHVLLSIREYERLINKGNKKIADLLAMPGTENAEFEITKLSDLPRAADLS